METAILTLIFSILNFLGLIIVFALVIVRTGWIVDSTDSIKSLFASIDERMDLLVKTMSQIAESKRLSTILTIEGKKGIDIKPEDFEPKREELREKMLAVMEEKRGAYERKGSASTWAYCILDHSGFNEFINADTQLKVKPALARLLANGNNVATKRFITMIVRNL